MKLKFTKLFIIACLSFSAAQAQTVSTFMGRYGITTDIGNNGDTTKAMAVLFTPMGMAVDNVGNFWWVEGENSFATPVVYGNRLRMLTNTTQKVYMRGGNPSRQSGYFNFPGGPTSRFYEPSGLAFDNTSNIYVADRNNHSIRKVSNFVNQGSSQTVTNFAGADPDGNFHGTSGDADGTGNNARFNHPTDIVFDGSGTFYVADTDNNKIKKINASGAVTTYAGATTAGDADGAVASARFSAPVGLALSGNKLYVADQGNFKIRVIDLTTNMVTTLAGTGAPQIVDGAATTVASFRNPTDVAVDASGNVYVSEGFDPGIGLPGAVGLIRKIAGGQVTTFAGSSTVTGHADGAGSSATFLDIRSLYFNPDDNLLYVSDYGNNLIRTVTTVSGGGPTAIIGGAITSGTPNTIYTFTDQSTGGVTSRSWSVLPNSHSFENGTTPTDASVDIKFTAVGTYTLTLYVQNLISSDVKNQGIAINFTSVDDINNNAYTAIYPNPAADQFTVEIPATEASVQLCDLNGRLISEQKGNSGKFEFSTSGCNKGIYLVRVISDSRTSVQKIVIQ